MTVVVALLDIQPLAIELPTNVHDNLTTARTLAFSRVHAAFGVLVAFSGTISVLGSLAWAFSQSKRNMRQIGQRWRCGPQPPLLSYWRL